LSSNSCFNLVTDSRHIARVLIQLASWQCMPGEPYWYCLVAMYA
jgi:hypothetical protein